MQCTEGSWSSKLGNGLLLLFALERSSAWVPALCSASPERAHLMLTPKTQLSSLQKPQENLSCPRCCTHTDNKACLIIPVTISLMCIEIFLCLGHECPYAIQASYHRAAFHNQEPGKSTSALSMEDPVLEILSDGGIQFVLKPRHTAKRQRRCGKSNFQQGSALCSSMHS